MPLLCPTPSRTHGTYLHPASIDLRLLVLSDHVSLYAKIQLSPIIHWRQGLAPFRQTHNQPNGQLDGQLYVCSDGRTDGQTNRLTDWQTDIQTFTLKNTKMNKRRTDGRQTDGPEQKLTSGSTFKLVKDWKFTSKYWMICVNYKQWMKSKKDKQWSGTDTIRSHILPSKPKGK